MSESNRIVGPPSAETRRRGAQAMARAARAVGTEPSRPEPGQLWIRPDSAFPVQWLLLESRDLPSRALRLVPVDTFGVRGWADLSIEESVTGNELSLRGGREVWLPRECTRSLRFAGEIEPARLQEIGSPLAPPSPDFATIDVDDAADYREWMTQVVDPAVSEMRALAAGASAPRPRAWRQVAAAVLWLGIGLGVGLGVRETQAPSGTAFAPLSPVGGERASGEAETYRVPAGQRDYSLLLALRDAPLDGPLELRFEHMDDPALDFTASELESTLVGEARYVSVSVPGRLLKAGSWRLTLSGDSTLEPLRYGLVVD